METTIFAPREQQLEGLKSTLKQVDFAVFLHALANLVYNKMMSVSYAQKLIKDARHILGISYEQFQAKYGG